MASNSEVLARGDDSADVDTYQRCRHARYFEYGAVYHVVFRTTQGLFLLTPDPTGRLRRIAAGILGRARKTFPGVRNHATTILSNHGHIVISGDAAQFAAYVGFIKRELSRRWGPIVGWRGLFEQGYHATAIITCEAQTRCLKYVLSQGVKEGLVDRPEQWPGLHCAEALVTGQAIEGEWLNGTSYGTALHREARKKAPAEIRPQDHIEPSHAVFDKLPALSHLDDDAYRGVMAEIVAEVVEESRLLRQGRRSLGAAAVARTDPMTRGNIEPPPWFEERRRMIVWDNLRDPSVQAYLDRYWQFQRAFRVAADRWRDGDLSPCFPPGAFRPGLSRPVPTVQLVAA